MRVDLRLSHSTVLLFRYKYETTTATMNNRWLLAAQRLRYVRSLENSVPKKDKNNDA
jgi:hypothetical protein